MPDTIVRVIGQPNSNLGFRERRVGSATILDADAQLRIKLRFGGSSVPLADAAESLMAAGQTQILLNLDGVSSLGAQSLGELVSAFVTVKDRGGELKIFNLAPTVRQMMQVTNLFAVFGLYESEADAIDSFCVSAMLNRSDTSSGTE
jgi:anti-sigma B factor antagonist